MPSLSHPPYKKSYLSTVCYAAQAMSSRSSNDGSFSVSAPALGLARASAVRARPYLHSGKPAEGCAAREAAWEPGQGA